MNPNYSDIIGRERPVHKSDGFDIRHLKMRRQLRLSALFKPSRPCYTTREVHDRMPLVLERDQIGLW